MSGSIAQAPTYDRWSLGSGEREIEMNRRQGAALGLAQLQAEKVREKATAEKNLILASDGLDALTKQFKAKYGEEKLQQLSESVRSANRPDFYSLSPEAQDFLRDTRELAEAKKYYHNMKTRVAYSDSEYDKRIAIYEAFEAVYTKGFDRRFTVDDGERLKADQDFKATIARMSGPEFSAAAIRRASGVPESDEEFRAMFTHKPDPSGLFLVNERGSILLNMKGLETLGPAEQAVESLKRLVTALTENNGLNQLRDGLIAALDGQNRTIADKAAALTAATKFDGA